MSTLKVDTIRDNGSGFNDVVTFANSGGTENGRLSRAFVNFNGSGAVAIRSNFNVNSISDLGTGTYTANFSNALTDSNLVYSHVYSNEVAVQHTIGFLNTQTASSITVDHYNAANSNDRTDKNIVLIAVFR